LRQTFYEPWAGDDALIRVHIRVKLKETPEITWALRLIELRSKDAAALKTHTELERC